MKSHNHLLHNMLAEFQIWIEPHLYNTFWRLHHNCWFHSKQAEFPNWNVLDQHSTSCKQSMQNGYYVLQVKAMVVYLVKVNKIGMA